MTHPTPALLRLLACAAIATAAGTPAHAQTAVNQTLANTGADYGYFSDAPGFPIALFVPGSYKLTGNLIVPAGASGIEIYAPGVTLDLNGFEIRTNVICTRSEGSTYVACPNNLGKIGVEIKIGSATVRNGRISGFETGLQYKSADHLENLVVENNSVGIRSTAPSVGARTLMRGLRVQTNRYSGIAGYSALVQGSTAAGNGGAGFYLGHSTVLDSTAYNNRGAGFESLGGPLMIGRNTSWNNDGPDYADTRSMGDNMNSAYTRF
jgi:hypothetical protein